MIGVLFTPAEALFDWCIRYLSYLKTLFIKNQIRLQSHERNAHISMTSQQIEGTKLQAQSNLC